MFSKLVFIIEKDTDLSYRVYIYMFTRCRTRAITYKQFTKVLSMHFITIKNFANHSTF